MSMGTIHEHKTVKTSEIASLYTIPSMYANGNLRVLLKDGCELRLSVEVVYELMKGKTFSTEKKAKYAYLTKVNHLDSWERKFLEQIFADEVEHAEEEDDEGKQLRRIVRLFKKLRIGGDKDE